MFGLRGSLPHAEACFLNVQVCGSHNGLCKTCRTPRRSQDMLNLSFGLFFFFFSCVLLQALHVFLTIRLAFPFLTLSCDTMWYLSEHILNTTAGAVQIWEWPIQFLQMLGSSKWSLASFCYPTAAPLNRMLFFFCICRFWIWELLPARGASGHVVWQPTLCCSRGLRGSTVWRPTARYLGKKGSAWQENDSGCTETALELFPSEFSECLSFVSCSAMETKMLSVCVSCSDVWESGWRLQLYTPHLPLSTKMEACSVHEVFGVFILSNLWNNVREHGLSLKEVPHWW